jgi:hypothetical protein
MKNSRNSIVYRGATQVRKSITSASKRRSLSKTYRGSSYTALPQQPCKPCEHTYRGSVYIA